MDKQTFKLTLSGGTKSEATQKIKALAILGAYLSASELTALAGFIKSGDPSKVALAKKYLGL